jgi:hypothetical protein
VYILVLPKINAEKYLIVIYMKKIIIIGLLLLIFMISVIVSVVMNRESFINPSSVSNGYPSTYVLPTDESATIKSSCGNGYDLGLDKQCYRCSSGVAIKQGPWFPSGYYCPGPNGVATLPIQSARY